MSVEAYELTHACGFERPRKPARSRRVPLTDGNLEIESAEGNHVAALKSGGSYSRTAGVVRNVINANEYEFVCVQVELIEPPARP